MGPAAPSLSVRVPPTPVSPAGGGAAPGSAQALAEQGRRRLSSAPNALTSRELADDSHGGVRAGPGPPQPIAALDPVAAVVAQHAGAQARGPPVGVVHSCVVLPDQGASCGKEGAEGVWGGGDKAEQDQEEAWAGASSVASSVVHESSPHKPWWGASPLQPEALRS